MKLPGGIQTNFMPMLFVNSLGGSFFLGLEMGTELARATARLRQKKTSHGGSLQVISPSKAECSQGVKVLHTKPH